MLEVLWSSMPPNPPDQELKLFEKEFEVPVESPAPKSPNTLLRTENPYTKLCLIRRQNSAASLSSSAAATTNQNKLDASKRMNQSLDENVCRDKELDKDVSLRKAHQSLDESKVQLIRQNNIVNGYEDEVTNKSPDGKVSESKSIESIIDNSEKEEKNPFLYTDSSEDIPSPTEVKKVEEPKKGGGHFKDLKDKLAAGKKGILNTLEKLEVDYDPLNVPAGDIKPKLVKNFNEFLNFAPTKSEDGKEKEKSKAKVNEENSPDDSEEYFPMTTSMTRDLKIELENLNRQVFGQNYNQQQFAGLRSDTPESSEKSPASVSVQKQPPLTNSQSNISYFQLNNQSVSLDAIEIDNNNIENAEPKENIGKVKLRMHPELNEDPMKRISTASMNDGIFIWQNPLNQFGSSENILSKGSSPNPNPTTPDEQTDIEYDGEIIEMEHGKKSVTPIRLVRKNGQEQSRTSSNRNSVIVNESDSEESDWNRNQIKLNANNPFYEQIQQMSNSKEIVIPPVPEVVPEIENIPCPAMVNSCEEASELSASEKSEKHLTLSDMICNKDDSAPSELPGPAGEFTINLFSDI